MNQAEIKNIIETVLMVSPRPLGIDAIRALFRKEGVPEPGSNEVRAAIKALQQDYEPRSIELAGVAGGFRFQARQDYAKWANHLFEERPQHYSRALLETLAIIAYRQPITRGEIEEIRGVGVSSGTIRTLQERDWIKRVGRREVPGRPTLFATTKSFLDYFNLKRLSDLPPLADIGDIDSVGADLFEGLEAENEAEIDQPPEEMEVVAETEVFPDMQRRDGAEEKVLPATQSQDDVSGAETADMGETEKKFLPSAMTLLSLRTPFD